MSPANRWQGSKEAAALAPAPAPAAAVGTSTPHPPPATGLALAWLAHVGGLAHVTPASEWACLAPEGSATSPLRPSVRPSARRVDPFHLAARAVGGALN